jgi:hypothetical protein
MEYPENDRTSLQKRICYSRNIVLRPRESSLKMNVGLVALILTSIQDSTGFGAF